MYTQTQQKALECWVGAKHQSIASYYDIENAEQGDVNIELAKAWFDAVANSPEFRGIVYRGICANKYRCHDLRHIEKLFKLNEGDEYWLTRPCSSTVTKDIGKNRALLNEDNKDIDHKSVLLICTVNSGRDIRGGPKHEAGDEEEIVLLHGLRFIVTKVEDVHGNPGEGEGSIEQKRLWLIETDQG